MRHQETLESLSASAVRGRPILKGLKHVSKFILNFRIFVPHDAKNRLERLGFMCSNAPPRNLQAITNQIILRGDNLLDIFSFEKPLFVFVVYGGGKGVVCKCPSFSRRSRFFKKGKIHHPRETQNPFLFFFLASEIEFVSTVFFHCLLVSHNGKGFFSDASSNLFKCEYGHFFNQLHYVFAGYKTHFNVNLCVFSPPICSWIFVA